MAVQRTASTATAPTTATNGGGSASVSSNASASSSKTGGSKRSRRSATSSNNAFNPKLIFAQIVAIQCFYYFFLGFIVQANHVLFATTVTIDRIFTAQYLDIWSGEGWVDNSAVLLSSIIGAVLLALIVEKSKKCLDFSVTLFVIHTVACTCYDGIPRTWDWWIVHILGMIIMILLGEFLCSRRELMDIPLLAY